jgi:hypothetical protein
MQAPAVPLFTVGSRPLIIPVVMPPSNDRGQSGRIKNVAVRATDTSGWLAADGEGGWVLTRAMERKGFRLLEDVYREESNLEGWATYKRYLSDWQGGKTSRSFPAHLLPKRVLDLQRGLLDDADRDPWHFDPVAPTTGKTMPDKAGKP